MKKIVYLDHNATTPVHPEVLKAMLPFYKDAYGNASSMYSKGREARAAIDKARLTIAKALGTEATDIIFTSCGTESDNFAIKGVCLANKEKGTHIITSKIEHLAVLNTCQFMEKMGFQVTYLNVDKYGLVDPEDLKKAITDKTILVTIMLANNEVGTIEPIKEIAKVTRAKGVIFHTDAVQAFGKIPVDVRDLDVDLLSLSAHKIYGPKGVGLLYIRKGTRIWPSLHGGHHERKLRAGTENVAGIVGFGKAAEIMQKDLVELGKGLTGLRDRLHNGLKDKIDRIYLNGHPTPETAKYAKSKF